MGLSRERVKAKEDETAFVIIVAAKATLPENARSPKERVKEKETSGGKASGRKARAKAKDPSATIVEGLAT